ncbi:MAG TPA: L,D-transpeptidase [bacterium]|nr:L,D-transpeptidase [bacterium]
MVRRGGLSAILAIILVIGTAGCDNPPTQLSQVAWQALQDSERQGAAQSAPEVWAQAQAQYDSAWLIIETQNRLWFFERDFEPAESLLIRSGRSAREAIKAGIVNREQQRVEIERAIDSLGKTISAHKAGINGHIARIPLRKAMTEAELQLATLRETYESGEIDRAIEFIPVAQASLRDFEERLDHDWVDPAELPNWNKMVRETVRWSKENGATALVVVKMDRRAYLLKGGRIVDEFPVEFGYRAWAQKMRSGDGATPEGVYHVTKWRDRDTKYYKALNINYPNEQDKKRFALNKKAGKIPRNAHIGGLIEIHGEGGKGEDWTEGCVALSNKDMDRLMTKMSVGDRVTIVREVTGWPD